ncbi:Rho GTPase-activating protein 8 [Smittium mucronatum]|uniref:Rho GTPase-activating protein 8 n=1 Tax=Smittium mucronatum TaxID=133383 RepID=A0A1R0GSN7_9FUNG|nr:Rho GTPase-activating protein 8 [Smittium mucronatum]
MKLIAIPDEVKSYDLTVSHILVPPELIEKQTNDYGLVGKLFSKDLSSILPPTTIKQNLEGSPSSNDLSIRASTLLESDSYNGASKDFEIYLIPEPIIIWLLYLYDNGLYEEGLFRRSPSSILLREAKQEFDIGIGACDLRSLGGVHTAAVLLKMFFKELDEPIFDKSTCQKIKKRPNYGKNRCSHQGKDYNSFVKLVSSEYLRNLSPSERRSYILEIAEDSDTVTDQPLDSSLSNGDDSICGDDCMMLKELETIQFIKKDILMNKPSNERQLLAHLFGLLYSVSNLSSVNKMTSSNLSIVISPNLCFSDDLLFDITMCAAGVGLNSVGSVVMVMISYFPILFQHEISQFDQFCTEFPDVSSDLPESSNITHILRNTLSALSKFYK